MAKLDTTFASTFRKETGAHYTPSRLASFVASKILDELNTDRHQTGLLKILDPAVGDGELLLAIAREAASRGITGIHLTGFDINQEAVDAATRLLLDECPDIEVEIKKSDFLEEIGGSSSLFSVGSAYGAFDAVIANPPYVRTQVLGSSVARRLAEDFNLAGRVDLYQVFIKGIERALKPNGIGGIIVSNRFMTTRSGESTRRDLLQNFNLIHVWDFGDTRLFDAAVLPAVLLFRKKGGEQNPSSTRFTSIYQSSSDTVRNAEAVFDALEVGTDDYVIAHGVLDSGKRAGDVWRVSTVEKDEWLATVSDNTKLRFKDLGKIRVGVKTTADKVFILTDPKPGQRLPEVARPLITHHIARRYRTDEPTRKIVYPHEVREGRRAPVILDEYPITKEYLESHRGQLEGRSYIQDSGRKWYEIWVPHNPELWQSPKLVFRDISEHPVFWLDLEGHIVNGDCYWLSFEEASTQTAWLALAVANSTFIEDFYDRSFHNKLYSGRRRFITQYVELFPLPDPESEISVQIARYAEEMYQLPTTADLSDRQVELDALVYQAFGLEKKS